MLAYNLEPDVYSFRVLNQLVEFLDLMGDNHMLSIHVELDTGMHRLGFEKTDINELIVRLKNRRNIKLKSVFSHFVGSEEHSLDYYTNKQIKDFNEMSAEIISHYDYPVIRHLCNSSAISRFPEAQYDMVRLGIGLYGISSYEYEQNKLQQVGTLRSIISQIRNIKSNDSVGYNRKGTVRVDSRIATVPIGYADGLSRRLSNGKGKFYVNGNFAPIIGNVCMDMVMIDVTNINCNEGDEVIIFGDKNPIANIADASETIPYEILTSISRRVKRVYYQE
jgi:alanine racemase